jgi:hypothetical protein
MRHGKKKEWNLILKSSQGVQPGSTRSFFLSPWEFIVSALAEATERSWAKFPEIISSEMKIVISWTSWTDHHHMDGLILTSDKSQKFWPKLT